MILVHECGGQKRSNNKMFNKSDSSKERERDKSDTSFRTLPE